MFYFALHLLILSLYRVTGRAVSDGSNDGAVLRLNLQVKWHILLFI